MKKHIIALSAIVLFSVLQGANAATMEDKPMGTEMQQPMQTRGTETMTKPMAADETPKTMMPATEKKGVMGAEKQTQKMDTKKKSMHSDTMKKSSKMEPAAPMMEQDKTGTTMGTMKPDAKETMKPQH
jgi:hypothetical protein